jgi:hypothetical protein
LKTLKKQLSGYLSLDIAFSAPTEQPRHADSSAVDDAASWGWYGTG